MSDWYDKEGRPLDRLEGARMLGNREYKRVAYDELPGDVKVSTVWLGLDHGFAGKPLIFETMVFGGPLAEEQERYSTLTEAMAGHAAMLERVKAATP